MNIFAKNMKSIVEKSEVEFKWCADLVISIKHRKLARRNIIELLSFQSRLARALYALDKTYRAILADKRALITKKKSLKDNYFISRMRIVDRRLKDIIELIGIGKCIGDGFAWIFYHSDRALIDEHLACKPQILMPPGVGGVGELSFIESLQGFEGFFVLYHGISSFLRMGDVSLIDFDTSEVAAIGELKTVSYENDTVKMHMAYIMHKKSQKSEKFFSINYSKSDIYNNNLNQLSDTMIARLKRQIKQIQISLNKAGNSKSDNRFNIRGSSYHEVLECIMSESRSESIVFKMAGNHLALCGVCVSPRESLKVAMFSDREIFTDDNAPKITAVANEIVDKSSQENSLQINSLGYSDRGLPIFVSGAVPMMWWPLNQKSIRRLVMKSDIIISLYNNSFLINKLRRKGYTISVDRKGQIEKIQRAKNGETVELSQINHFIILMTHFLVHIEVIMSMVEKVFEEASKQQRQKGTKIFIRTYLH